MFFFLLVFLAIVFVIGYASIDWNQLLTGQCTFPEIACQVLETIGLPSGWLTPSNIFPRVIIPLVAISFIVFFAISMAGLGGRGIRIGLSIVIAFATIPSPFFVPFAGVLLMVMGFYSFILVGILGLMAFFMGFAKRVRKYSGPVIKELKGQKHKLEEREKFYIKEKKETEKEMEEIKKAAKSGAMSPRQAAITLAKKKDEIDQLEQEKKTLDMQEEQIEDTIEDTKEEEKKLEETDSD